MADPLNESLEGLRYEILGRSDQIDPWDSFWYYRPTHDFPPRSIRYPDDYGSSERLAVACTQTDMKPGDQKRLVQSWCNVLPSLESVKFLWLTSRVPQLYPNIRQIESQNVQEVRWQ